jgi:hypothetical protein
MSEQFISQMVKLSNAIGLINKYTNVGDLTIDTKNFLHKCKRTFRNSGKDIDTFIEKFGCEIINDIIAMWYPAIYRHMKYSGRGGSGEYWDIDIDIETYIREYLE